MSAAFRIPRGDRSSTGPAVGAEIARRATDEAWAKELERRQRVDAPGVIHYPA